MNREFDIDKLFREGLQSSQKDPPVHLWNNIADSIKGVPVSPNGHKRSSTRLLWWFGTGFLVAVLTTGIILHKSPERIFDTDQSGAEATIAHHHHTDGEENIIITSSDEYNSDYQIKTNESPVTISSVKSKIATAIADPDAGNLTQKPVQIIANGQKPAVAEPIAIPMEPTMELTMELTMETTMEEAAVSRDETSAELYMDLPYAEAVEVPETQIPETQIPETDQKLQKPFAREMLFGLSVNAGSQLYNAVAPYPSGMKVGPEGIIAGSMHYKRFNLRIGAGLNHHSDVNRWQTTVLKPDTVTWYEKVTGVTFVPVYNPIDSTITGYTPDNFTTVNFPIIDTIEEIISHSIKNRYTYFSVPVIAGFDIWHRPQLTIGVHTGVIFNKRVYERRPLPEISGERIIFSEDLGLIRREYYRQYQAGINGRYEITTKWFAEGAVAVRWPAGSWYNQHGLNGKPVALLISAGVGIWL